MRRQALCWNGRVDPARVEIRALGRCLASYRPDLGPFLPSFRRHLIWQYRDEWRKRGPVLQPEDRSRGVEPPDYADLYEGIARLPAPEAWLIRSFYFDGYSIVELGRLCGQTPRQLYRRLRAARRHLHAFLV